MKMRLAGGGASAKDNRAPAAVVFIGLAIAVVATLVALFLFFDDEEVEAAPRMSADGEKLLARGEARSAEMRSAAARLTQKPVGEGYQFDADGRLLGTASDGAGLPSNRTLAQMLPPQEESPTVGQIRAGVRHRSPPDEGGERHERGGVPARPSEVADRALLTQSMLAYSTGAAEASTDRQVKKAPRPPGDWAAEERQTDERLVGMMERLQDNMLAQPLAGEGVGASGQPGQAKSGGNLYPAATSPQSFVRGGVGDMRISTGPSVVVRQGKFIDCALVNHLRVDLAESPVVAMVTRNLLSSDGNYVLVPAGAKLLGSAGSVQSLQQARVYLKFDRVIFPDQRAAYFPVRQLGAVDGEGAIGVPGDVNRHLMLQFGAAIMLGVLDGLAAAVQGPATTGEPGVRDMVLGRTSGNFASIVSGILQRYANVVPTVSVAPGATMKVFFAEDVRMNPYIRSSDLSWMRR